MFYIPKKSRQIYSVTIAHRGYHVISPENTIASFNKAINLNMAIETDVRMTKDKVLVCYHDRYLKKHLNIKGKICQYNYNEINKLYIKNSMEKVPTLNELLNIVQGRVILLLEIKGYINEEFKIKLCEELNKYNGTVFFHAKNVFTYFYYRKIFGDRVFFVLNPIRKRFNFIKVKNKEHILK